MVTGTPAVHLLQNAQRYYAEWVDAEPHALADSGAVAICSPKRDEPQLGYSQVFRLYCFVTGQGAILSYSRGISETVPKLMELFDSRPGSEQVLATLVALVLGTPGHSRKFHFTELPQGLDTARAVQLRPDQFPDYLGFFRAQHPGGSTEWLESYFVSMAGRGYAYGVYDHDQLVGATDAPDVPYTRDTIGEPGINTLAANRRQGHATAAVGAMLEPLLATGRTPVWSCAAANQASASLATSLGYRKLADVYTVTAD